MRTAERLFSERGVDRVSMLEIQEASGQRNHSAVKYHFGDVRGLVEAILERHSGGIQQRWMAELDALDADGPARLRALVSLLAQGMASKLDDPDGGREYLELAAQLVSHPTMPLQSMTVRVAEAPLRLGLAILEAAPMPVEIRAIRAQRLVILLLSSLAERAREERRGDPDVPRALALADLIDGIVAMLRVVPSAETKAFLAPSKSSSAVAARPDAEA
jgi:AcrR family transcriptional regulator